MDKGLTVPRIKMDVDKSAKNTPRPQNLLAQIVCPSPQNWNFEEKSLHWASIVRALTIVSRHLESHFYFSYFCVGCMLLLRYICARSPRRSLGLRGCHCRHYHAARAAHHSQPQGRVRRARRRRRRYRCVSWHFAI